MSSINPIGFLLPTVNFDYYGMLHFDRSSDFHENDYNNDIRFYFVLLHFLTQIRVRAVKTENKYSYSETSCSQSIQ